MQNEARKLNHQEVIEEDRRKKLPSNWDAKQRQVEWEEKQEEMKKVSSETGSVVCPDISLVNCQQVPVTFLLVQR